MEDKEGGTSTRVRKVLARALKGAELWGVCLKLQASRLMHRQEVW